MKPVDRQWPRLQAWARTAAAAALCACSGPQPRTAGATAAPTVRVSIAPAGGDVWSWQLALHGAIDGPPPIACDVVVSARRFKATIAGSRWTAEAPLAPGTNVVRAACSDARGARIETDAEQFEERLADVPRADIDATGLTRLAGDRPTDAEVVLDARGSAPNESTGSPVVDYAWTQVGDGAARDLGGAPAIRVPRGPVDVIIRLDVIDSRRRVDSAAVLVPRAGARAARASLLDGDVVYGIVPPLAGDPPLRAVTRSLAELRRLGVSVVWLTPTFEAPAGDFGYAVTDYLRVRSSYGAPADLADLVTEAHRLGLRVILDLPANATSDQHPYFADTRWRGERSPYYGFYARDAAGLPRHDFAWANLPDVDYADRGAARWMIENALYWVRQFHVDGYRLDAAWGPRTRTPAFWPDWVKAVRRIAPDAVLVAEGPARDPYYGDQGFDAAYDWSDVGRWSWQRAFDDSQRTAERLREALGVLPATRVLRFLDNNDTGPRFITRHGLGMTRVAAALLLTAPGVPCLFMGDETGVEYDPYAARGPLPPGSAPQLRDWYARLIGLRAEHPSLRRGSLSIAPAEPEGSLLVFERHDPESRENALVVLNFGSEAVAASVPADEGRRLRDLLSGRVVRADRRGLRFDVAPWGVRLFIEPP